MEVSRPVARRQGDRRRVVRRQKTFFVIEFPELNFVQSQINVKYESPGGVGFDHVRMSQVVPADGEAPRRCVGGFGRPNFPLILLEVAGRSETAIGSNR